LTDGAFFDKDILKNSLPDKAKPSVRRGRKAAGLFEIKMAELPEVGPFGSSAFLFCKHSYGVRS
jgi:hypothetical protein